MMKWLAFDIGCLECGESSRIIGIYNTKEEAEKVADIEAELQQKNWNGQHSMQVFEITING